MLSGVSVSNPESSTATQGASPFRKVGENLYRLKTSGTYYARLKRGGKQIRKSLGTKDKELAIRNLAELRKKVGRLNNDKDLLNIIFEELASRWLTVKSSRIKASSLSRIERCIKGLTPFFKGRAFKNVDRRRCEDWLTKRGREISASSYNQERGVMVALFK